MRQFALSALALAFVTMGACDDQVATQPVWSASPDAAPNADAVPSHPEDEIGAVFVSTNAVGGNTIVAFSRGADGSLARIGEFGTGGVGTGGTVDPLASQGAVVLSNERHAMYVVNAGDNSFSSFAISNGGIPQLLGVVDSRGTRPVSIALSGRRIFVLNAGDNSVSGFAVPDNGVPKPIPGSKITLGAATDGPCTINVSHDGKYLFVTQRAANAIDVIAVDDNAGLHAVSRQASSGGGPFGFAVTTRDQLIVAEAAGDAPNGAVSSYSLLNGGSLGLVTGSASTHQHAPCWLILSGNGHFAYAANAGSGSISGYAIGEGGVLRALSADGRTGVTNASNATPIDMGISRNGRFLYVLQTGTGTIGTFAVGADGRLSALPDTPGLAPASGLQGLAAF